MKWDHVTVNVSGETKSGVAPIIVSASRSTDIPAFHAQWLAASLAAGYVKWTNPFNRRPMYVSFEKTRAIVFWSKNPQPLLEFLPMIDSLGIAYYFQFTLNDYEREGLEPHVPPLQERIATFIRLANLVGRHRVIWRFDPLILAHELTVRELVSRIRRLGDQLHPYTEKLVFSFADICAYTKVQRNLNARSIPWHEFSLSAMHEVGHMIADLAKDWSIEARTCAEQVDLAPYGVGHNRCIDDELLYRIAGCDPLLRAFLRGPEANQGDLFSTTLPQRQSLKDKGQRLECGCIQSKDIGQYNTCPHMCVYCYANAPTKPAQKGLCPAHSEGTSNPPLAVEKTPTSHQTVHP